jgi:hypothetical protein
MKGFLCRVGIDSTKESGKWNAPVGVHVGPTSDEPGREFVYVPKSEVQEIRPEFQHDYSYSKLVDEVLLKFAENHRKDLYDDLKFPKGLESKNMHLDPDFNHLTYGDKTCKDGKNIECGKQISKMQKGDILAFYSGLKSIDPNEHDLVYALIGLYVLKEDPSWAKKVPESRRRENAHTRRENIIETDVVVWAEEGVSGRLKRCIPIGEKRNGQYRVLRGLLEEWGDLGVKDGWIQRRAHLPQMRNPEKFYSWFKAQGVSLEKSNY